MFIALRTMDPKLLQTPKPSSRKPGEIKKAFRYVARTPELRIPLAMMALVGTLAYEFQVVLPLLARVELHGGADTYGFLTSAMGAGAVAGGLFVAGLSTAGLGRLTLAAAGFGAAILAAAIVPSFPAELAALACVGAGSTAFIATGNTTLQLTSDPQFRGRVMALWSVTFLGSTPVGGPLIGLVAQYLSPRIALGAGGLAWSRRVLSVGHGAGGPAPRASTGRGSRGRGRGSAGAGTVPVAAVASGAAPGASTT